jgi:hypothetical protein
VVRALITLALIAQSGVARAGEAVGVVVGGADAIRTQTEMAVADWLTKHSLGVAPAVLTKDGVKTLLNCLVIADMSCARTVVEVRATANNVVSITEQASGKKERRSVQLSAYWITKHQNVVSLQRTCDNCSDEVLAKTVGAMMADLVRLVPSMTGHVHVTSDPAGTAAMIDHEAVGVTPVDRQLSFGSHTVTLTRNGHTVGERQIEVEPGGTLDVAVPIHETPPTVVVVKQPVVVPEEHRSRAVPAVMIGIGVAGMVTGGVLYATSEKPTGKAYTYRDTKLAGIGVGAGGAVVALVGTILFLRGGSSSAPTVGVTSSGASIGWAGRF